MSGFLRQIEKKKYFQIGFQVCVMLFCIVLDQFTKHLAVLNLKNAPAVPLISDVFELSYLENHGAAFGIMQGQKVFFICMTAVAFFILVYLMFCIPWERHYVYLHLTLLLLASGAVGNFNDRCLHGYVIDFFYFKWIDFPVFNVADIYVTVAAALLLISFTFYYKEEDIDLIYRQLLFWKKKEKH